jgi:NAD(P)-dependent dehydrogenase (short-subunit alcohol dehydrogenase family)
MSASPFSLSGKTAVVTGAASGIGKATAEALAAAGAHVVVADRNMAAARAVAAALPSAVAVEADVTDEAAIETMLSAAPGPVDILVNNAGLAIRRPAVELTAGDWNKVVDVNMTAVFLCSRAAARRMIARGSGGAIVNVASIMGLSGGGLYPNISYQTTKGAVVNMTRALAVEWAPHGIRVNAVAPTYVRTPFIKPITDQPDLVAKIEAMTPLRRLAEPEDVASAILFLASPGAAMVTGHTLPVDGGFLAQ